MKKHNLIFLVLLGLIALFATQSCNKEDSTTFTKHAAFTTPLVTSPVALPNAIDGVVKIEGTTAVLSWESTSAEGDPVKWDIYFGKTEKPAMIESGYTQNSITVDVEDGTTYFWKVVIVDHLGIKTTSELFSFTPVNGTNPEIGISMTVATDVKKVIGVDMKADDVVDLRFLILNKAGDILATVDNGYANEAFDTLGNMPDGDYVIATDLGSATRFGDLDATLHLDLQLNFHQFGILDQTFDYAKVMTNEYTCDAYRTYLATIKKEGAVYTIEKDAHLMVPSEIAWYGTDADDSCQVVTVAGCDLLMTGLGFGWMLNWWGENIVAGGTLVYTIDGSGNIDIPLQYYCTTKYKGAVQPDYKIQGTGTIDNSGTYPVMNLKYDFIQSGTSIGTVSHDYGWPTTYFEAAITTDPAITKSMHIGLAKPVRK
jgi:hypothetical protein